MRSLFATCALSVALWAMIAGCGGGGGDGGGTDPGDGDPATRNDVLSGTYQYVHLQGTHVSADVRVETGKVTADGAGALTFETGWSVSEGLAEGPFTPPNRTYSIAEDLHTTVVDGIGLSVEGKISDDGALASLCSRVPLELPAFLLLTRRLAAPTATELAGDWILVGWYRVPISGQYAGAAQGEVAISATGAATYTTFTYVVDGLVDPVPVTPPQQDVVVGTDGWLRWRTFPGPVISMRGAMSEDKNLMVFIGDFGLTQYAAVRVLVRAGSATGTTALQGSYASAGFGMSSRLGYPTWGNAELNGSGVGTYDLWTIHGDAVVEFGFYNAVTYGVTATGATDLRIQTLTPLLGATGPGGRYAVLTGPFSALDIPWFQVLLR